MGIIRFAIGVFVVMALFSLAGSLFGGAAAAGFATVGALALIPILVIKGVFLFLIIGFFARRAAGHHRRPGAPWSRDEAPVRRSDEDRFEEWHRMAHAKEEVDSWTPEL